MSELSKNRELAEKLWQVSERVVDLAVEEKLLTTNTLKLENFEHYTSAGQKRIISNNKT